MKLSDNPCHNILEYYNILLDISFNTSKMKLDIQYSKHGIGVTSRVTERLKTQDLMKLQKYQKSLHFGWTHSLVPSFTSRNQSLLIAVKKHAKTYTKLFFFCPVLLDYSILFQIFCPGLSELVNFQPYLGAFSFQHQFLDIFYNSKAFLSISIKI